MTILQLFVALYRLLTNCPQGVGRCGTLGRMPFWSVYMVRCGDGSLYTGASNDVPARVKAHNEGRGARYTRVRRPVRLLWVHRSNSRSNALSLEARLKQLSRVEKLEVATGVTPVLKALGRRVSRPRRQSADERRPKSPRRR